MYIVGKRVNKDSEETTLFHDPRAAIFLPQGFIPSIVCALHELRS